MEHERTNEEIKSVARKKAKAKSVTVMTVLILLMLATNYLEKTKVDENFFVITMFFSLLIGLLVYLATKKEAEYEGFNIRELQYEAINLSQAREKLIEPVKDSPRFSKLRREGAKLYARLTFGNNICILVKHKDGEIQNYSWLKKGRFRENYRIVSP